MKLLKALFELRRTLFPNCQETSRLQSQALDRPLTLVEKSALGLHLFYCRWCRRYGRQLRFLRLIARHPRITTAAPPDRPLSPEARERMKQVLRNETRM